MLDDGKVKRALSSLEIQAAAWRQILILENGNITRAAARAKIDRSHATRLTKKFDLNLFAAELRLAAGAAKTQAGERKGVVTGRPRKSRTV